MNQETTPKTWTCEILFTLSHTCFRYPKLLLQSSQRVASLHADKLKLDKIMWLIVCASRISLPFTQSPNDVPLKYCIWFVRNHFECNCGYLLCNHSSELKTHAIRSDSHCALRVAICLCLPQQILWPSQIYGGIFLYTHIIPTCTLAPVAFRKCVPNSKKPAMFCWRTAMSSAISVARVLDGFSG